MSNLYKRSCILISIIIPSLSSAHSGHGNTTVKQYLHDLLFHSVYGWNEIVFVIICIGCGFLLSKSLLRKVIIIRSDSHNNDRYRRKS